MKPHIAVFAVTALLATTFFPGCGKTSEQKLDSARENVGDATQDLKDARTAYLAEWQTFKRESERLIAANEKRIAAFKEKMEKAGPKMKARYDKEVAALERRNRDLKRKLEEYTDGGQSKWEEFKVNFARDMDAIGKTMTDLFKDTL